MILAAILNKVWHEVLIQVWEALEADTNHIAVNIFSPKLETKIIDFTQNLVVDVIDMNVLNHVEEFLDEFESHD